MKKLLFSLLVCLLAVSVLTVSSVQAAEYPRKPIKLIIPFPPGGSTDALFRVLAVYIEKELNGNIVIINTKGGGGAVGMQQAMKAKPDGYTIGVYMTNTEVVQAVKMAQFTNDDMTPIVLVGDMYLTVTVLGSSPFNTLKDYADAAKQKPGEVGLAMGHGSLAQFVAAMVEDGLGVDLKLVNAGDGAQKKAAVLGGHVEALIEPTSSLVSMHKAGQLRIIAVLAPERLEFLPDVPTAKEQGVDVVASQTFAFMGPKGIPQDVVDKIAAAAQKALQNPECKQKLLNLNLIINFKTGDALAQHIKENHEKIFGVAKKLGY